MNKISNYAAGAIVSALAMMVPDFALAQTELAIPIEPKVVTPSGVNLWNGQYAYSSTDVSVGDLTLSRDYGGVVATKSKYFGDNWSHNFDMYVWERTAAPRVYAHVVLGGRTVSYLKIISSYSETDDAQRGNQLSFASGKYTFLDRNSRSVYTFAPVAGNPRGSAAWLVEKVVDPDGRVVNFTYASGRLKLITSNRGSALVFDYNASGNVSAACGFNLATTYVSTASTCVGASGAVSYGYSGTGTSSRLISFVNGLGHSSTISYDATFGGVACVTDPGTSTCPYTNSYDYETLAEVPEIVVRSQVKAGGGTLNFSYFHPFPPPYPAPYPWEAYLGHNGTGSWQDETGKSWFAEFKLGQPVSVTDPRLPAPEKYEYNWTDLLKVTYPEGNYVKWTLGPWAQPTEERRRDKTNTPANDIVQTATYADCWSFSTYCRKPLSVTDARGGVTDSTYDAAHGGLLTQMSPAPAAGGARPLLLRTYVQKYAYVKNSGGSLVAAATPVWVPATETSCQTVAGSSPPATCDSSAQQAVTTYEYGAAGTKDALMVKGMAVTADGQTLRTCYSYDMLGRKISETKPAADLATCP